MNSKPSQTVLGFLDYREFDEGEAYRGAILITDEWSKPLEFRCTAPVRPTHLQRTLYGKSLLPHILNELIGAPLIASVKERPQLIFITCEGFFDMRYKVDMPVIRVSNQKGPKEKQSEASKTKSTLLHCASGKFNELEIESHWKFATDLSSTNEQLRDLYGRWDLTEPFLRLTAGLQFVHDERVIES